MASMDPENASIILAYNAMPRWARWPKSLDEYNRYFLLYKIISLSSSLIALLLLAIPSLQEGITADRIYGCNDTPENGCAVGLLVPIVWFSIFILITIGSLVVVLVRRKIDSFVIYVDGFVVLVMGIITYGMTFVIYKYVVVWMPRITGSTTEMSSTSNSTDTLCSDCYKDKTALCFCNGWSCSHCYLLECSGCYEYMGTHHRIFVEPYVAAICSSLMVMVIQVSEAVLRWHQNRLRKAIEGAGLLPNLVPVLANKDPVKETNQRVKSDRAEQVEPIEANQETVKKQEVISEV